LLPARLSFTLTRDVPSYNLVRDRLFILVDLTRKLKMDSSFLIVNIELFLNLVILESLKM
jgi:hypothetical protein